MGQNVLRVAAILVLASPAAASAHADYEYVEATVRGADGTEYALAYHYTDGIVMADPVKLVVRDPAGRAVAETPYGRDVVLHRAADGTLYAFAVDRYALSFWEGWAVEDGRLARTPTTARSVGSALVAVLGARWLWYGPSALLCVAAVAGYVRRARRAGTCRVRGGALAWVAATWLLLLFLYGSLSVLLVVGLSVVGALPVVCFLPRRRRGEQSVAGRPT